MPRKQPDRQQNLLKALTPPVRMRILSILAVRVASPVEMSRELEESLGVVSYHVRMLEELDCIELVKTEPRRGAVEHYYRAIERPWLTREQMADLPTSLRRDVVGSVFAQLAEDVMAANNSGSLGDGDT